MLDIHGLNVYYDNLQVLWDVSLHIDPGEIVTLLGANGAGKSSLVQAIFGLTKSRTGTIEFEGTDITGLPPYEVVKRAGTLSGGEQQMLAIARSLMAKPKILVLDEPSLGLSPLFVTTVLDTVSVLNRQGLTILLVEQNVQHALEISHRGYILENGRITLEGLAADLLLDDHIKSAYLGL
jgi:branched-chain amino acid transport system ATP-binding protein